MGRIDEVRVYNVAMTAAQVQADMNSPIVPAAPALFDSLLSLTLAGVLPG